MAVYHERLEGLTSAEFQKAERFFRRAAKVQLATTVIAAVSIFLDGVALNVLAAVAALILYASWATLDWFYKDCRGQAERGRRALLIADGIGGPITSSEMRDIESGFSTSRSEASAAQNEDFFASERDFGEGRLAELIEESGFYSCRLYKMSAGWAWRRFALTLVISLGLFLSSTAFAGEKEVAVAARLLCTVLVFLVGQEVLGTARAYMRAHEALGSLQARIQALRLGGFPRGDLLLLLGDYNSAVEGAPLMAPGVYKRAAPQLDELWRRHMEEKADEDGKNC